jgi:hypothetical protein
MPKFSSKHEGCLAILISLIDAPALVEQDMYRPTCASRGRKGEDSVIAGHRLAAAGGVPDGMQVRRFGAYQETKPIDREHSLQFGPLHLNRSSRSQLYRHDIRR